MPQPPSVFLSHNHRDKEFARRLARDLSARGAQVWLDEAVMYLGDSLLDKIGGDISKADYVAVLLSRRSVKSDWVQREVAIALGHGIQILPVLIEDCEFPGVLQDKVFADFRKPEGYGEALDLIVRRLGLPDHSSAFLKARGMAWPLPDEAFTPVEILKLHVVFYDAKRFYFGNRLVLGNETRVGDLDPLTLLRYFNVEAFEEKVVYVAHYEAKDWLLPQQTLGQAGVKTGEHLIFCVGTGAAESIERLVMLFGVALERINAQGGTPQDLLLTNPSTPQAILSGQLLQLGRGERVDAAGGAKALLNIQALVEQASQLLAQAHESGTAGDLDQTIECCDRIRVLMQPVEYDLGPRGRFILGKERFYRGMVEVNRGKAREALALFEESATVFRSLLGLPGFDWVAEEFALSESNCARARKDLGE